ncbi:MAG: alpha/beta hydrolase [Bdellovibrionota bacterium]
MQETKKKKSTAENYNEITIPARDGIKLAARHYPPVNSGAFRVPKVVVFSTGIGIRKEKYHAFASYLARTGARVIVFDYRGIGGSLSCKVKDTRASMTQWGSQDLAGVIDWVMHSFPKEDMFLLAHNSGQLVGLAPNCDSLRGMILVGCTHGYWGHWHPILRSLLVPAIYAVFPLLTAVFRYFPSRHLGLGENLPAGVARELFNWTRKRDSLFALHPVAKDRLKKLSIPILVYSFKDDIFAPKNGVRTLLDFMASPCKQWNHISPRDLRVRHIGHYGFFSSRVKNTLWDDTINWLKGC